ncbi:MAG: hypothetical protein AAF789_03320 [Bacteroidota bacterium]
MRAIFLLFILLLSVSSACEEEFFPNLIFDYQVERLLAGDSTKYWDLVNVSGNCADSMQLQFVAADDSVDVFEIFNTMDCDWADTVELGRANASNGINGLDFSDSLIFKAGSEEFVWIVTGITSRKLSIRRSSDAVLEYRWNDTGL